jgi:hypothetical protein
MKKIKLIFAWYDFWIGLFYDTKKKLLYIFPLPMVGIVIDYNSKQYEFLNYDFLNYKGVNKTDQEIKAGAVVYIKGMNKKAGLPEVELVKSEQVNQKEMFFVKEDFKKEGKYYTGYIEKKQFGVIHGIDTSQFETDEIYLDPKNPGGITQEPNGDEIGRFYYDENLKKVLEIQCYHPKEHQEYYHDFSILCTKCNCIIEQNGEKIDPPTSLI